MESSSVSIAVSVPDYTARCDSEGSNLHGGLDRIGAVILLQWMTNACKSIERRDVEYITGGMNIILKWISDDLVAVLQNKAFENTYYGTFIHQAS
jgi:hypothetical protein